MNKKLKEVYETIRQVHAYLVVELEALRKNVPQDMEECADNAYALREALKFHEANEKDMASLMKQYMRTAVLLFARSGSNQPIRTEYVTATPLVNRCFQLPSAEKQPNEYAELMTFLGVDPQLWDYGRLEEENRQDKVVDLYWPGLQAYLRTLEQLGNYIPDTLKKVEPFNVYELRMVKKKGVTNETSEEVNKEETPF